MKMGLVSPLFVVLLAVSGCLALDNGLARTPPMGWLSWERFLCNIDCTRDPKNCISEQLYKDMADRLVQDGFKDLGYEYVNIDDCWMSNTRDSNGRLQPDSTRFPGGIKALSDYMHARGLKLGIYQDCGSKTCAGYPGSENFFEVDAQTYADWGVDMVKMDGCNANPRDMDNIYPKMTLALNKTGRPMIFSCSWPDYQRDIKMNPKYAMIAENCNLWRNFDDIGDSWESVKSILDYYNSAQDTLVPAAGPGQWNDPDMLIIGNFGLSTDQAQTQMALWAIYAAPLLMSNDLRDLKQEFKDILQNKRIIDINQDPLGKMGKQLFKQGDIEFYVRPVSPTVGDQSSYAIVFLNRREIGGAVSVTVPLSTLNLANAKGYTVRDLYTGTDLGTFGPSSSFQLQVNPSGVVMYKAEVVA